MIIFQISNNWVKALRGKSTLKELTVTDILAKPINPEAPGELSKFISSLVDEKSFRRYKPIALCVPRNQVTLRSLKFPSQDEKELDSIVNLHLTQQVPYAREEIIHNYSVLKKDPSGFTEVLLGIMHREFLVKQFSLFEKLNLYPENVQISASGLMRFLKKARVVKDNDTELKACLDIDIEFSELIVFRGGSILFSKSIDTGNTQLSEQNRLEKFINEIKQAMVVFQAEKKGGFSKLYLSGVWYKDTRLDAGISEVLNTPVERIDATSVIASLSDIKNINDILGRMSLTSLLGVAMDPLTEKFNFILPEAKLRREVRLMARNLIITGSTIAYLIVLLLLGFVGRVYSKQTLLNKLTAEISTLDSANKNSMDSLEKIKSVRNFTCQRDSFLFYYYELTQIIPESVMVDRVIYSKHKEFSMVGKGSDMGEIFRFVKILNDAEIFGKVELRYSRKKTKGKKEFNEFEIMCHVK